MTEAEVSLWRERVGEGENLLLLGEAVRSLGGLLNLPISPVEEELLHGVAVPLSFTKELFDDRELVPLYLPTGRATTPTLVFPDFYLPQGEVVASGHNGSRSFPLLTRHPLGKGALWGLGIQETEGENLWATSWEFFLQRLDTFISKGPTSSSLRWRHHCFPFEELPFLLKDIPPLAVEHPLLIREARRGVEKGICGNEWVRLDFGKGQRGVLKRPPLTVLTDLLWEREGGWKVSQEGRVSDWQAKEGGTRMVLFPSAKHPSLYAYLYREEGEEEVTLSYRLAFRMLPPYPESFFSRIYYSLDEANNLFAAYTPGSTTAFFNRASQLPLSFNMERRNNSFPELEVRTRFRLLPRKPLILQFTLLRRREGVKKSEIKAALKGFRKKDFEEALKADESRCLRMSVQRKEHPSLDCLCAEALGNRFKDEGGALCLHSDRRNLSQEEWLDTVRVLGATGFQREAETLLESVLEGRTVPWNVYPCGSAVVDSSLKGVQEAGRLLTRLRERRSGESELTRYWEKRREFFNETNFWGLQLWKERCRDPEWVLDELLNPRLSSQGVLFAPAIPFFITDLRFWNIPIGAHRFDFTFKRREERVTLSFQNHGKEEIPLLFSPLFNPPEPPKMFTLKDKKEVGVMVLRDFVLYSRDFAFPYPPRIIRKEESCKLMCDFPEGFKSLVAFQLELYGQTRLSKIVGARIHKVGDKKERTILYTPSKSGDIYLYFRKEEEVQKKLFS